MVSLEAISRAVRAGKGRETEELIYRALEDNHSVESVLKEGLAAGINAVDEQYGKQAAPAVERLLAARALNRGIRVLQNPALYASVEYRGTVICGTVKDDLREIEKDLISVMMRMEGLRVVDLGASVNPERFVEAARREGARIILCSAALVGTMAQMKNLVTAADAAGVHGQVKIMICGRPVTEQYRAAIGADFFAADITGAAETAAAWCRDILLPAA